MPIYEYQCPKCSREFQKLVMKSDEEKDVFCPTCGDRKLKRLISRVSYHVSENDRIAAFDPTQKSDSVYKDNRNIGLSAQKRARQMGVDLGKGFDEKLEKLRSDPSSVFDSNDG